MIITWLGLYFTSWMLHLGYIVAEYKLVYIIQCFAVDFLLYFISILANLIQFKSISIPFHLLFKQNYIQINYIQI